MQTSVQGMLVDEEQSEPSGTRKMLALIDEKCLQDSLIRVYIDGSTTNMVMNGAAGIVTNHAKSRIKLSVLPLGSAIQLSNSSTHL
ncbi:hypothetical protein PoB_001201800 [Plakobranchus ocellatus]|uniref:Uncharacterized protein n=1 Tax=Plakobranchus ocellatus TaxID=259542 RepID=A0AAV3YT12_9GAST|nr:hypothetical protein PoB_001201800 [Plakobranchus ocellatus]